MLRGLHNSAILLRSNELRLLPQSRTQEAQRHVQELGTATDIRFMRVDLYGNVLADSIKNSLVEVAGRENHRQRLELLDAAKNGVEKSRRVGLEILSIVDGAAKSRLVSAG